MNPATAIDVRLSSEVGTRSESASLQSVQEEAGQTRWRGSASADGVSSKPALEPVTSGARTAEMIGPGR